MDVGMKIYLSFPKIFQYNLKHNIHNNKIDETNIHSSKDEV